MDINKQKNFGMIMNYGNIDVSGYTTGVAMERQAINQNKMNQYLMKKITL